MINWSCYWSTIEHNSTWSVYIVNRWDCIDSYTSTSLPPILSGVLLFCRPSALLPMGNTTALCPCSLCLRRPCRWWGGTGSTFLADLLFFSFFFIFLSSIRIWLDFGWLFRCYWSGSLLQTGSLSGGCVNVFGDGVLFLERSRYDSLVLLEERLDLSSHLWDNLSGCWCYCWW